MISRIIPLVVSIFGTASFYIGIKLFNTTINHASLLYLSIAFFILLVKLDILRFKE